MPKRRNIIPPKDLATLIKNVRRGQTIELESLSDLAPRAEQRIEIVNRIFALGVNIRVGNVTVAPEHADILILGMRSQRRRLDEAKAKQMGGQNRISEEDRAKALPFWQDETLSVKQLEKFTGYSMSTLRRWFADDYPRSPKRGRPKT